MFHLPGCGPDAPCLCGGVEVDPSLVCPSGACWALGPEAAAALVPDLLPPSVDGLHAEHGGGQLHSALVSAVLYTNTHQDKSL